MLIRIAGRAEVWHVDGRPVLAISAIRALDGAESDEQCSEYLDSDLADLGIGQGTVKLIYDAVGRTFRVSTEYTSPVELDADQLRRLVSETAGQWSDGIGEACFDDLAGRLKVIIDLSPSGQEDGILAEQIDDGSQIDAPRISLARAARDGDMASLRRLLDAGEAPESRMQGYTPLHLAILYGRTEAARKLIAHGADINARAPQGEGPLMLAALSNSLADADAAEIARALLDRGASVHGRSGPAASPGDGGYTPLSMAEDRGKAALAAILREYGATE